MTIRRTIVWVFWLLLCAGVAGGTYVWKIWAQSDRMLYERVAVALAESLPGWEVSVARARFDLQGQIRLYDIKLGPPGELPWAVLPETVISVDREQLVQQRLVFHQVRLLQPQISLSQDKNGTWNWEGMPLPKKTSAYPVEWKVERGTVYLRRNAGTAGTPEPLALRNVTCQLTPEGQQRYIMQGSVALEPGGVLHLDGSWRQDEKSWLLNGRLEQLRWDDSQLARLLAVLPELRERIAQTAGEAGIPTDDSAPPRTGLQFDADIFFRLQQAGADQPLNYKWFVRFAQGTWEHDQLPFPITRLQGKLYGDNQQIRIPRLTANSEQIGLLVENFRWRRTQPGSPVTTTIQLTDLPLDDRTKAYLSPQKAELLEQLQVRGAVNLTSAITYSTETGLQFQNELTSRSCSAAFDKFPYPVQEIVGTIKQRGTSYFLDLQGVGSGRPVTLAGSIRMGDDEPGVSLAVDVEHLPMDDVLWHSCPEAIRPALQSLRLRGECDLHYTATREGAAPAPWGHKLTANVRDSQLKCTAFPLEIDRVTGQVGWDGKRWTFSNLHGWHGEAELTAAGNYIAQGTSGLLTLNVVTPKAKFTETLRTALPPHVQQVWLELSPRGEFACNTTVRWMPKQTPDITFKAQLLNSGFTLKSFPYSFQELTGQLEYEHQEAKFTRIRGRHDETRLSIPDGWAVWDPQGWRVRLEQFALEDLVPDNKFRRALPTGFREVIDSLDPRSGLVNVLGMLEFRGTGKTDDPVTAAWDLELLCTGLTVTTGIDLERLYGKVFTKGTWDGEVVDSKGQAKLDSLSILGYQIAQVAGPVQIKGTQLTIGSNDVVNAVVGNLPAPKIPVEQRITGRAINGLFTLDGIAVLGSETSYRVFLTMNDARLERYAELYLPQQQSLRGVMNGWAELSGRGNTARQLQGRGQLRIRPAALYELPVLLAVFKVMKGFSPDKTAFDEGQVDFTVQNLRMDLNRVDLIGNALTLRGRGWVRFDRRVNIDFYSTSARNKGGIPILSQVWGQATEGLFGVEVRGTLDRPLAEFRPAPKLDDAMRSFLGILDGRPAAPQAQPPYGRVTPRTGRAN